MRCIVCDHPIENETFVGAGSGDGDDFAHYRCYRIVHHARNTGHENKTLAQIVKEAID